jgi:hypothetical protein
MSHPIPGVFPAALSERTIMVVWPSLAAFTIFGWPMMERLGRVYGWQGLSEILPFNLTVGKLLAVATIPVVVPLYFLTLLPRIPLVVAGWTNPWCVRYRLTNRRVITEQPFGGGEQKSVSLDHFDSISVDAQPGHAWYRAGDLVFRKGQTETFRLAGVPRPETFRQTCLKAHQSFVGVAQARKLGVAV